MNLLDRGLRAASNAAKLSNQRARVGSALLAGSRVVSTGWNVVKTHPKNPSRFTQHAEFKCLCGVDRENLSGYTLFVVRLSSRDQLRMARPCGTCRAFLVAAGLRRVYWTSATGLLVKEMLDG